MTVATKTPDFAGWATKANVRCTDGRTIGRDAFVHQDQTQVPLVWHHGHDDPSNILGHAILTNKPEGVWAEGYFNDNPKAIDTNRAVKHKDISWMSIYANELVERGKNVLAGVINEVSLVIKGANPGARIEHVSLQHSDDPNDATRIEGAAFIFSGEDVLVGGELAHAADTATETGVGTKSYEEIYNGLDDAEKETVHVMITAAVDAANKGTVAHDGTEDGVAAVDNSETDSSSEEGEEDDEETKEKKDGEGEESDATPTPTTVPDTPPAAEPTPTTPADGAESTTATNDEDKGLAHQEGSSNMTVNLFEQNGSTSATGGAADSSYQERRKTLTREQITNIMHSAKQAKSLKEGFLAHANDYGFGEDIGLLFPEARAVTTTPQMIQRQVEWVQKVIGQTKTTPFSKVRTLMADITADEARAKGYTKGKRKVEEVIRLLRRSTGPTTIYKKQRLDRDDLVDITDFDLVDWLWAEINMMLLEELARAILVGDGRSALSDDKIKDPAGAVDGDGIRSVLLDDDLFSIKIEMPANVSPKDSVKHVVRGMADYRGSGSPTLFISRRMLIDIMLEEDKFERPLYATQQALMDKLLVKEIVTVDLFDEYDNLFAIIVNLQDYNVGTNAGGQLTRFNDFDIDYNQFIYLLETRLSGGLVKPYSAVVVRRAVGTLAVATAPSYNGTTKVITIPTAAGVSYFVDDEEVTGTVGPITGATEVAASPDDGYYLESNTNRTWTYTP